MSTFCARKLIVTFMLWSSGIYRHDFGPHNDGRVNSTKERRPFELVYWEGCRNESDAAQREKYLKTAWENVISKIASDVISRGKACNEQMGSYLNI